MGYRIGAIGQLLDGVCQLLAYFKYRSINLRLDFKCVLAVKSSTVLKKD